ncbi:glycoside hydrolase family 3 N-terminal domain-containing protein [Jonesia quinghaiensis]|uniref:glycoside hydrolase family 3 N-terminal domain-containing protein n=1 Tax=Jonesia quinghaiensis TaxID=262806 RepID=UPI0003FD68D5|nr:glycoside hydrolase family 3 N-terminal domain-containing protein [Jonesia quinghaiensis]
MRNSPVTRGLALAGSLSILLASCSSTTPAQDAEDQGPTTYTTREVTDGTTTFTVVDNPRDGETLSFSKDAGFTVLEEETDGVTYAFKDMNGNGSLDPWEDWRLSPEDRAADLAPQVSIDQVSGLMLFSSHERAPGDGLTDAQKEYLADSYLRNVLYAGGNEIEPVVLWTNEMQAHVETLASESTPYIPVNFSTDPRNDAKDSYAGAEGGVSQWPALLGLAATFDAEVVRQFGEVVSAEYRAMGLANGLSPQIDLATEPRWGRITGTLGEDADMAGEMAKAYVDGFQNTYDDEGNSLGWGEDSVSTVIKHFPGDGTGEGGREAHTESGKYAVLPGGNSAGQLKPFTEALSSGGLMTSYSIILDAEGNPAYGNAMGSAYDKERVDILRVDNNYDGVIVTDWGVTSGGETDPDAFIATSWGAEKLTVEERHFEILKAGVDQFGGNNDIEPLRAAYDMWGEAFEAGDVDVDADARWADTGRRVLTNIFRVGLYENPYQDLDASLATVGNDEFVEAGLDAQHKSVISVKNSGEAMTCNADAANYKNMTVYIPQSYDTGHNSLFGPGEYTHGPSIDIEVAEQYFGTVITDEVKLDDDEKVTKYTAPDLSDVDMVLVGMRNPDNGGNFTNAGMDEETKEFYPLSLQYRPYTADGDNVRKTSIGGDILEDGSKQNRSYFGETSRISNEADLDAFERATKAIEDSGKDIPVITMLSLSSGMVIPAEFEADSDGILVGFGVSDAAMLDVALGLSEPGGRLPIVMPKNMDTVEASLEDVAGEIDPYVDSAGNSYEFGFGLTCGGEPIQ